MLAERVHEGAVERLGLLGRRGPLEPGTAAAAQGAGQRELRDDEDFGARFQSRPVHFPRAVFEDAHMYHLVGKPVKVRGAVAPFDPDQHEQPPADAADDLPLHPHLGAGHALDHALHRRGLTIDASSRTSWLPRRTSARTYTAPPPAIREPSARAWAARPCSAPTSTDRRAARRAALIARPAARVCQAVRTTSRSRNSPARRRSIQARSAASASAEI